jgi:hypothetical protein
LIQSSRAVSEQSRHPHLVSSTSSTAFTRQLAIASLPVQELHGSQLHGGIMESHLPDPDDNSGRDLVESLRDTIRSQTNGQIRGLEVTLDGTAIVISGRTSRYYYKQLATSAVLRAAEQHDLTNHIQIES